MKCKDIYDRTELCDNILSQIVEAGETEAFILYAGTGVGKTSVSLKIANMITERKIKKDVIQIKSSQEKNLQEGAFISYIFQNIRKYYLLKNHESPQNRKRRFTYSYYIRHQNVRLIKTLLKDIEFNVDSTEKSKWIIVSILRFFKTLYKFLCIKTDFAEEQESNYTDIKLIKKYIKYIIKKGDIVLCIENAQYFDKTSIDFMIELLIETKHSPNFYIFEFTLNEDSDNLQFLNEIKNELDYVQIAYSACELKKLDPEYVIKLANQLHGCSDKSLEAKIVQMYTGNIKKVENFVFINSVQAFNDNDPTFELLHRLTNDQKYIMAIILLNNTAIAEQFLIQIINNSNDIYIANYKKDIDYLINIAAILEKRDNIISIKDNDTVNSWNKNIIEFKKYEAIAYKNCESIFVRIIKNNVAFSSHRRECILKLLQLYNRFDVIKLNNMLEYIDEVIYEFASIEELENYLEKLIQTIYPKKQTVKILFNIFEICNRHQLVKLEAFCLDKIRSSLSDSTDEKYLFCYFTNLLQKEEYSLLLERIKEKEDSFANCNFRYYVELFKIVAYVSLNQKAECQKIICALENDKTFRETPQYGYFLRLAEAYEKRNIAIPSVEKSITIFEELKMDIQVAKSQVSLSFLYSVTGNLDKARNTLDSAEKILLKNIENKHIFNINKACLYLLNHNYTEEVWDLLNEAEVYTCVRFDKIAIIINKLIWCIENKDYEKGKYYEKKGLEFLELEDNHHLHAIFYYDCYVLYTAIGDIVFAQKYYDLAMRNKQYCDTLNARLEGKDKVDDQTTFLLQYPWHICFVSYWYFDYV